MHIAEEHAMPEIDPAHGGADGDDPVGDMLWRSIQRL
jgi:hypothetical protein